MWIERHQGPSKLDEKINALRDPDGNVWLHPKDAAAILFSGLFAFYKGQMAEIEKLGGPGIPVNVEALAQIASVDSETRLVNLVNVVREVEERRKRVREEQLDEAKVGGQISSRKSPRREF